MQKTEITLSFDGEKLDALEFYLKKENTTVQIGRASCRERV